MSAQVDGLLSKLEGVKPAGQGRWMAKCPGHDDRQASLSVREGDDGRVLVNCHANCTTENVVTALGMSMSDLFPPRDSSANPVRPTIVAEYDYRDEKGKLLYQAVRLSPKSFRQRRPTGGGWEWALGETRRVLFRLPELLAAAKSAIVWVAEGEKDVLALVALGLVATTNVGGAGKWRPEYCDALRGHPVVILPDNDDPGRRHAVHVATLLKDIAASVKVVTLPGLPPKGDVSDWLATGGTKEKLLALAERTPPGIPAVSKFKPSSERIAGERDARIANAMSILSFGISYLDQALGGLTRSDLVLVGAKSGVGKTALVTSMALANCADGRRVHYFALEAEEREIERRMKFQIVSDLYHQSRMQHRPIRFQDWYNGLLDDELRPYEDEADERLEAAVANLHTYYRNDSFTSEDFREQFDAITPHTDLVILDHFHYIDADDKDENKAAKQTVKQIRDCVLRAQKPVVIVAHVRKADRRNETLLPTLDDFHGSSDLPKIATKAVMIAPAYDVPPPEPHLWPTYIQAAKCRTDMSVTRYTALMNYNTRRNSYGETYALGRLTEGGRTFVELVPADMPPWARVPRAQTQQDEERWS